MSDTRVYISKTYGFSVEGWTVFGLSSAGARDNFRSVAQPDDWVFVVGTTEPPTPQPLQGRVLGKVRVDATTQLPTEPYLTEVGYQFQPEDFGSDGKFRWPYGMLTLEAHEIIDPPDLKDLVGDRFGRLGTVVPLDMMSAAGASACASLLALPSRPLQLPAHPRLDELRRLNQSLSALRRKSGQSGPPPSFSASGYEREDNGAVAYLLRLKGGLHRDAYKIGRTSNAKARLATLNAELRYGVTGCRWVSVTNEQFPSEGQAHVFEQTVLERLHDFLADGEREIVIAPLKTITDIWDTTRIDVLKKPMSDP